MPAIQSFSEHRAATRDEVLSGRQGLRELAAAELLVTGLVSDVLERAGCDVCCLELEYPGPWLRFALTAPDAASRPAGREACGFGSAAGRGGSR